MQQKAGECEGGEGGMQGNRTGTIINDAINKTKKANKQKKNMQILTNKEKAASMIYIKCIIIIVLI